MSEQVRLIVGTRKGAFIYSSDQKREKWEVSGPILPGWSVYNAAADLRDGAPRLYLAANHWAWGPSVTKSTDLGKNWDGRSEGLGFPQDMGVTIQNVWSVSPGHASQPGVVYCGTQPAGLFRSEDWGASWKPVDSLNRHSDRQSWSGSGGGDSCVHSLEVDPRDARHFYAIISAGGSYVTRMATGWEKMTTATAGPGRARPALRPPAVRAGFAAGRDPQPSTDAPDAYRPQEPRPPWFQAIGVFRSDDGGTKWADVTEDSLRSTAFPSR
jgi:hypothetical protein